MGRRKAWTSRYTTQRRLHGAKALTKGCTQCTLDVYDTKRHDMVQSKQRKPSRSTRWQANYSVNPSQ